MDDVSELHPLGLAGFKVSSLRADTPAGQDANTRYTIGALRLASAGLHLVAILTVIGEAGKGLAVLSGDAVWRDKDFDVPLSEMSDDDLIKIVANSFAIHSLYDAAAMVLRQSFATMGLQQEVSEITPEPEVDILQPVREDDTNSLRERADEGVQPTSAS